MRARRVMAVVVSVGVAAAALVATSPGSVRASAPGQPFPKVDQPGVTDTEIRVGGVASTTNPLGGTRATPSTASRPTSTWSTTKAGSTGASSCSPPSATTRCANNAPRSRACSPGQRVRRAARRHAAVHRGGPARCRQDVPTFGWNINSEWGPSTATEPEARTCSARRARTPASPAPRRSLPWLARQAKARRSACSPTGAAVGRLRRRATGRELRQVRPSADSSIVFVDTSRSPSALPTCRSRFEDEGHRRRLRRDVHGQQRRGHAGQGDEEAGPEAPQYLPNAYDHEFIEEFGDLFEGSYVRTDFTQFEVEDKPKGLQDFLAVR